MHELWLPALCCASVEAIIPDEQSGRSAFSCRSHFAVMRGLAPSVPAAVQREMEEKALSLCEP